MSFFLFSGTIYLNRGLRYATEAEVAATTSPHAASLASAAADVPSWHARGCHVSG